LKRQQIRTRHAALCAGLLAIPALAFPAVSAHRQAQARAAYDEARRLQASLETQPEVSRPKADYEKVILKFHEVYRLNPASANAPASLAAIAALYEEMGRILSSQGYYRSSAQAYKFLIAQYPWSPISRDALFALAEVYRGDLNDPQEARKTFRKFLELYPKSAQAARAREQLKEMEEPQEARRAPAPAAPSRSVSNTATHPPDYPAEVTAIRRWVGPNYSRIVIGLEGEAKFDTTRLANPDRIVLDLSNTRLSADLVSKLFPVEDGFLRQIRIAQFKPTTTRVVLDVVKIEDYSIFTLPNPFRLIVDIHGAPASSRGQKSLKPKTAASLTTLPADSSRTSGAGPDVGLHALDAPLASRQPDGGKELAQPDLESDLTASAPAKTSFPALPNLSDAGSKDSGTPGNPSRTAAGLSTRPSAPTLTRVLGLKIGRVVIDPGHGGHDTGTIGPTGLREKDLVLDVALRLKKLLVRNTGASVVLTRRDDTFVPLEERTAIANEKAADLFISIHANASRDRSARGVETYYLNFTSNPAALEVAARENATSQESVHELEDLLKKIAMTEKIEESQAFARLVQHQVYATLARAGSVPHDRGLKKAPFVVLIGANMPSILAEISFLTNPRDERLLKRSDYRQRISEALYVGIARYVNTLGRTREARQARRGEAPAEAQAHTPAQANDPNF
jgi:N-acetylmuramoyl-L-alanine amidase